MVRRNVEQQVIRGGRDKPAVTLHFIFKLARPPAGIAERRHPVRGAAAFGNGAKNVDRSRQHPSVCDLQAILPAPIPTVQNETTLGFDRPAQQNRAIGRMGGFDLELAKQIVKSYSINDLINTNSQRPFFIMRAKGDHGVFETGIANARKREQQLSCQKRWEFHAGIIGQARMG